MTEILVKTKIIEMIIDACPSHGTVSFFLRKKYTIIVGVSNGSYRVEVNAVRVYTQLIVKESKSLFVSELIVIRNLIKRVYKFFAALRKVARNFLLCIFYNRSKYSKWFSLLSVPCYKKIPLRLRL